VKKTVLTLMIMLAGTRVFGQQSELTGEFGSTATDPAKYFKTRILTNAEFDAYLAKPDQILLIDFRGPDELLKEGGFPVFMIIQPNEKVEDYLAWIPKGRTIITTSRGPVRGGKAGDILTAHGYKVAGTIGAFYYEQAGGTLTKFLPRQPAAPAAPAAPK
jgi:rhodanese-related sulfurtransferase